MLLAAWLQRTAIASFARPKTAEAKPTSTPTPSHFILKGTPLPITYELPHYAALDNRNVAIFTGSFRISLPTATITRADRYPLINEVRKSRNGGFGS